MKPKIFIASFGSTDVIHNTLCLHHLKVDDIYTSGRYENYEDGDGMDDKNQMIQDACKQHHLHKPFLIDDSKHNIVQALTIDGAGAYHVQGSKGLTDTDVETLLPLLEGHDAIFIDADKTLFRDHITSEFLYDWLDAGHAASTLDVTKVVLAEGSKTLLAALR